MSQYPIFETDYSSQVYTCFSQVKTKGHVKKPTAFIKNAFLSSQHNKAAAREYAVTSLKVVKKPLSTLRSVDLKQTTQQRLRIMDFWQLSKSADCSRCLFYKVNMPLLSKYCCAPGCEQNTSTGATLHQFPSLENPIRKQWDDFVCGKSAGKKWVYICSLHFSPSNYAAKSNRLLPGSVPKWKKYSKEEEDREDLAKVKVFQQVSSYCSLNTMSC